MSSIMTNTSAMNALTTLRGVTNDISATQERISTGLKVSSGKDNAVYFSISETMKGDSSMNDAINESLTLTKNTVSSARMGAETFKDLASQFADRVAFAGGEGVDRAKVQQELDVLVERMDAVISQSSFNGSSLVDGTSNAEATADSARYDAATDTTDGSYDSANDTDINKITSGVTRTDDGISTTSFSIRKADLVSIKDALSRIDLSAAPTDGSVGIKGQAAFAAATDDAQEYNLRTAEAAVSMALDAATDLGVTENTINSQQEFLTQLSDRLDANVGSMVDANMEEEAARLQALQVQQQLSVQALSIANSQPQNILALFQ